MCLFYSLFAPGVYACPWFRCSVVIFTATVNSAPRVWYERSSCVGKVFSIFRCASLPLVYSSPGVYMYLHLAVRSSSLHRGLTRRKLIWKVLVYRNFGRCFDFPVCLFPPSSVRYWSTSLPECRCSIVIFASTVNSANCIERSSCIKHFFIFQSAIFALRVNSAQTDRSKRSAQGGPRVLRIWEMIDSIFRNMKKDRKHFVDNLSCFVSRARNSGGVDTIRSFAVTNKLPPMVPNPANKVPTIPPNSKTSFGSTHSHRGSSMSSTTFELGGDSSDDFNTQEGDPISTPSTGESIDPEPHVARMLSPVLTNVELVGLPKRNSLANLLLRAPAAKFEPEAVGYNNINKNKSAVANAVQKPAVRKWLSEEQQADMIYYEQGNITPRGQSPITFLVKLFLLPWFIRL